MVTCHVHHLRRRLNERRGAETKSYGYSEKMSTLRYGVTVEDSGTVNLGSAPQGKLIYLTPSTVSDVRREAE